MAEDGTCGGCGNDEILRLEVSEEEMKDLTGLTADDLFGDFLGFHVAVRDGKLQIAPRYEKGIHTAYECEMPRLAKAVRKI